MKTPPRVLHIVSALFGSNGGIYGGAERYALELARYMAHEVPTRLITFGDMERHETIGSLRVRVIGNPWYVRGQRQNPLSLALLAELHNADVVHCHQQHVLASSIAALFLRLSSRRVFVTELGGGGWDISAYISTDRLYDGHLHISEYSRKISGHTQNGSAKVISGGVDTDRFCPDESVVREGTVLFVGRLLPHKGVNDLIDALPSEFKLEIVGQPCDPRFLTELRSRAVGKRVTFRYDCGDRELVHAYRQALCVVLPSVYRTMYGQETVVTELLGQTLLEGMACGTPVICTNVAAMPEIVKDGITGFVVPPNNPAPLGERIRWLYENPAEAERMGKAARRWILEKFTWPQVVRKCLEIYGAYS